MSFLDGFKKFLGIKEPETRIPTPDVPYNSPNSSFFDDRGHKDESFGFNVFSNPLEMQRYFEREMENVLKSFGLSGSFFGSLESFDNFPPNGNESSAIMQDEPKSLREHYLKPTFEDGKHSAYTDTDVDGKFNAKDVETMLKKDNFAPAVREPSIQVFGQSFSSTTVQKPDGSVEIRRSMHDREGNQETTVTRKFGDKEHTITTKIDKDGKKEVIENLVNMSESDAKQFLKQDGSLDQPSDLSIFDKFFGKL